MNSFSTDIRDTLVGLLEEKYIVLKRYDYLIVQGFIRIRIYENFVSMSMAYHALNEKMIFYYGSPSFIDDVFSTIQNMIDMNRMRYIE